jgi:hypothetical protein
MGRTKGFKTMRAYRILVHDARLGPFELAAEMKTDTRAREFALERYRASDHVQSIEVWSGAVQLCAYGEAPRLAA